MLACLPKANLWPVVPVISTSTWDRNTSSPLLHRHTSTPVAANTLGNHLSPRANTLLAATDRLTCTRHLPGAGVCATTPQKPAKNLKAALLAALLSNDGITLSSTRLDPASFKCHSQGPCARKGTAHYRTTFHYCLSPYDLEGGPSAIRIGVRYPCHLLGTLSDCGSFPMPIPEVIKCIFQLLPLREAPAPCCICLGFDNVQSTGYMSLGGETSIFDARRRHCRAIPPHVNITWFRMPATGCAYDVNGFMAGDASALQSPHDAGEQGSSSASFFLV